MRVVILEDQCWTKTNGSVSTASQNNTWNEHRIGPLVISMFAKYSEKFRSLNEDNLTVEGQQKLPKSCWPTPWYSTLWREWPQASQQLRITLWVPGAVLQTLGVLGLILTAMERIHPAQSSSSIWDFRAAVLYWSGILVPQQDTGGFFAIWFLN